MMRRLGRGLALLALAWLVGHLALVLGVGLRDDRERADLAVVPGNTVLADGTPSPRLRARLDRAVELYRAGAVRAVLVSGGRGAEGYDEAEVMARHLAAAGVPTAAILVDHDGADTFHTARNAVRLMRERGYTSVYAVSQYFHVARCKLALARSGAPRVLGAHARYFEARDLYAIARELVGYDYYLVRRYSSY